MRIKIILLTLILLSTILNAQTGSIRNTLGTGGSFIVKDSANNFLRVEQTTGNAFFLRNIELGADSNSSSFSGVILKGGLPFIHNYRGPNTSGYNTFIGLHSGNFSLYASDPYASFNGSFNTAVGWGTLTSLTTGSENCAFGYLSMISNTEGIFNSAFGHSSLYSNTTGYENSGFGHAALHQTTTGKYNSAFGSKSLYNSQFANENSAFGYKSLYNCTASFNSAFGSKSLENNTTGVANSAFGIGTLQNNISGSNNTAIGNIAGSLITTGNNNIAIGFDAQVPNGTSSNQIRIGNTSISYAGIQVAWSITSDRRWKENIQPTNLGLNFISKLNPVFYTRINDENQKIEYGLIAQELEQVLKEEGVTNAAMLTIDGEGRYELRYNDLFAPMIKAIQELKNENDQLKSEIESLKSVKEQLTEIEARINLLEGKSNKEIVELTAVENEEE